MKSITSNLALSQLKQNRKRTGVTIAGIALSAAMITAVFGFAAGGIEALRGLVTESELSSFKPMFVSLAAILGSIIVVASVVVISNAFRISASERMRQFGILKSVGATRQQIMKAVLFEALFLCAVSIPIGMAAGMLIQWFGSGLVDTFLAPMNRMLNNGLSIDMQFVFSWPSVLLALCLSLCTVMVSAWLPARKAANIPAIEAIRLTREIQNKKDKKPRAHRLARMFFGFEGALAAKSIQRSRRSYRSMVAALTISVILFLVCGSLDTQMRMTINQTYANIDATTFISYVTTDSTTPTGPRNAENIKLLTDRLAEYPDTQLYGLGIDSNHLLRADDTALSNAMRNLLEPEEEELIVALVLPDAQHYSELCRAAGVPEGSNILINSMQRTIDGRTTEFQPIQYSGQTLTLYREDTQMDVPLDAQLTAAQVPQEFLFSSNGELVVVVPDITPSRYYWFGNSADSEGYAAYAEDVMRSSKALDSTPASDHIYTDVLDVSGVTNVTRSLTKLITVFLYGFVGMLSLIGLTSVLAAIAASVRLRAREFAVLTSVGMTQRGVRRMLALESIMSAFKALLFGIPLGSIAMYLTYWALTQRDAFQFVYPWLTVVEAVAAIFLIAAIATQYAASKLRKGSVMDAIRSSEGV